MCSKILGKFWITHRGALGRSYSIGDIIPQLKCGGNSGRVYTQVTNSLASAALRGNVYVFHLFQLIHNVKTASLHYKRVHSTTGTINRSALVS